MDKTCWLLSQVMCFDLSPCFLYASIKQDLVRCIDRSFTFLSCLAHLISQKALSSNMIPESCEGYRRAKTTGVIVFSCICPVLSANRGVCEHRMGMLAAPRLWESVNTEWEWLQLLGCGPALCGQEAQGLEGGSWTSGHFHLWKWLLPLRHRQQYFMSSMVSPTIKCQSLQLPYLL